jgi:hypothetical protein
MAALGVVAVLGLGAPAAGAKVVGQEHYSGTDSFTTDECGFTLNVESTFHGQVNLRVLPGGEAFLTRDKFWYVDRYTNPETGGWFEVRGNTLFHEIHGTLVSGTIYEFIAIEAGQPFAIYDSSGRLVLRDRGVLVHDILFDTLGDGMPGGELVADLGTTVHGPHPGFGEDFDFCATAAQLTGA